MCVLSEKFTIDDIESSILIDTSAEEKIKYLKNSFLSTESKKDSIGVHMCQQNAGIFLSFG